MSYYDSMLICSEQSSLQGPCPNKHTISSPSVLVIEEKATFLDTLAMKTVVRMAYQLISVFHDSDFDISVFHEKLRNISDCKMLISNGIDTVFRNSGLEQL